MRPHRPARGSDAPDAGPGEAREHTGPGDQRWLPPDATGPIEIGPDGRLLITGAFAPGWAEPSQAPDTAVIGLPPSIPSPAPAAPDTIALPLPPGTRPRRLPWEDGDTPAPGPPGTPAGFRAGTDAAPPESGPTSRPTSPPHPPEVAGPSSAEQGSRLARLARRASWNLTDQVITAATNTALFVVLARSVSTSQLDAFTNAFYVFTLLIGVGRAMVGQVLSIRFSSGSGRPLQVALGQAFGFVLALTSAASVIIAAVGAGAWSTDGGRILGAALLALAAVLPALIMQDACRMAFFARSNAKQAALNDGLWAVLQFSAIAALIRLGHAEVGWLVLAWGGGAAVCVLLALTQLRVIPAIRGTGAWLRRSWDLSRFFLAENLLTSGAFTGGFLLVGALVGEGAVSAIRGAQVLVGPLETLSAAMFTFALPELARRTWLEVRTRWKIAVVASTVMFSVALLYTVGLWLVPDDVGRLVFRDNWDGPREIVLAIALGSASARACLGPAVTIYAMGLARRTFRLMTVEAPLVLTLMIGGALAFGVQGAAWGLAINQTLLVPLWFLTLRSVLRMPRRQREAEAGLSDGRETDTAPESPEAPGARRDPDATDARDRDRSTTVGAVGAVGGMDALDVAETDDQDAEHVEDGADDGAEHVEDGAGAVLTDRAGKPYRPRHATTGSLLPEGSAADRPRARHSTR